MEQSKKGYIHMFSGITLSKFMCPKTQDERTNMSPYALEMGPIIYVMLMF